MVGTRCERPGFVAPQIPQRREVIQEGDLLPEQYPQSPAHPFEVGLFSSWASFFYEARVGGALMLFDRRLPITGNDSVRTEASTVPQVPPDEVRTDPPLTTIAFQPDGRAASGPTDRNGTDYRQWLINSQFQSKLEMTLSRLDEVPRDDQKHIIDEVMLELNEL